MAQLHVLSAFLVSALLTSVCLAEAPYEVAWSREFDTPADDYSRSVAVDGLGNAYIAGDTGGDAFLAKYDSSGDLLWAEQIGSTSGEDSWVYVDVDASGNAYISGRTYGSLGGPNAGETDVFLAKYDSSGELVWKVLNYDEPENKHFIKDFGLVSASLVVVEMHEGEPVRFDVLQRAWSLARDEWRFDQYVHQSVLDYLGSDG